MSLRSTRLSSAEPAARVGRTEPLFEDVFLGGFVCTCQKREDGRQLDRLAKGFDVARHRRMLRAADAETQRPITAGSS